MKKLKILALMHEDLVPPDLRKGYGNKYMEWKTEFDVISTLSKMGHRVETLGVYDDLGVIRNAISTFKPDIAFNLLEEFHGNSLYDYHIASYLELLKLPYTGCNPRGLLIAHDKALSKKLLTFHRIHSPGFDVFPIGRKIKVSGRLKYPLIVKSLVEEGSYGLSQASVVYTEDKLIERIRYLQEKLETPVLVEEYIEGRELYLSVLGNERLQTLTPLELIFGEMPEHAHRIATSKVKWDWNYQEEHQIDLIIPEDLSPQILSQLKKLSKRIYRLLGISGYARIDLRLTGDNKIYVLEANANPDIGTTEELAWSAEFSGISYEQLLQKVLYLGLGYRPERRRA